MNLTCCDSRVLISEIFGNEPGDFFIHRNIANLVPPHAPDSCPSIPPGPSRKPRAWQRFERLTDG
jgi:hypothetical protein